jgi:hypothetical protein
MNTRPRLKGLLLAVGLLTGVRAAWAGDSIKAVDRCQELAIGDRSSFVLVKDLYSEGQDCLTITSNNLTLDLDGFAVVGAGTGRGIIASASVQGVTVRNGTVRGFAIGVSLGGSGNLVEDVRVENNTDTGMFLGASSIADHVVVQGNWQYGAILSTANTFKNSSVRANGNTPASVGLSAGPGSTIAGNTIWANTGTGLFGSTGGTVIGNTVTETVGIGMSIICPSNLQQNTSLWSSNSNLVVAGNGCLASNNVTP